MKTLKTGLNTMRGINNKRVLITGGSSGIGLEAVKMFLKDGAYVGVCCNSNIDKIKHLEGDKCKIFKGDLTDERFVKSLVSRFINHYGKIDILVNNAGTISSRNFLNLEKSDFIEMLNLNLFATYFLMRDAYTFMMNNGGGKIINLSSISVKYGGSPNTVHYAVSKIGIESMSLRFAKEGVKHNILVNCIRPGYTDTPIHDKLGRTDRDKEKRIKMIPLGRAGKPEEIAGMIEFLASDYGSFSSGEIFTLSGGD